jgi:hypothetical protein
MVTVPWRRTVVGEQCGQGSHIDPSRHVSICSIVATDRRSGETIRRIIIFSSTEYPGVKVHSIDEITLKELRN